MDDLDIIFQNAYRDNITNREDYSGLSNKVKMQIKKSTKKLFLQIVKQFGTINTSSEMFEYLYDRAIRETDFEEDISVSMHSDTNKKIRSNLKD